MLNTLWGVVRKERIELLEATSIPEGARALVTILPDDNESHFWIGASRKSLDKIWNKTEDDVYAQLLEAA